MLLYSINGTDVGWFFIKKNCKYSFYRIFMEVFVTYLFIYSENRTKSTQNYYVADSDSRINSALLLLNPEIYLLHVYKGYC